MELSPKSQDGFGIFTWADGRRYEGYWSKGNQHGFGRLCHEGPSGMETRAAEWADGERIAWLDERAAQTAFQG